MKVRSESVFNFVILGVLVWFLYGAVGFPPAARTFPLIVTIPAAALAVWVFVQSLVRKPSDKDIMPVEQRRRLLQVLASLIGMVVAVWIVGIVAGMVLYGLLFTLLISRRGWLAAVGVGVFGFLLVFVLFGQVLHFPLYGGMLNILSQ